MRLAQVEPNIPTANDRNFTISSATVTAQQAIAKNSKQLMIVALQQAVQTGQTLQWLLALAGQDLSSFFHNNELAPIERTNRNGERVPIFVPCLERNPATQLYWYRDPALVIGRITFHPCPVKIINTLTFHETEMIVCYEDTIGDVREKYLRYNDNAYRYEWRKDLSMGSETGLLRMDKTLTENGYQVNLRSPIPVIWIFYILPPGTIDTTNGTHSCSGTSCNAVNGPQAEESQNASASPGGKQSINATTKTNRTALDIHECAKN
uniref:Uncharacterized protein n=1 Tax=Anopheles melas TaxID=34690 RepID=A0A182UCJ7_9DIPT